MEKCIEATKEIIESQVRARKYLHGNNFDGYQKMYAFTNENIKSYINFVSSEQTEEALCVLSSGDHVFNLISKGILNIDTFDTNKLTEFYALGFKRAMILKYNFEEFKEIMHLISSPITSIETITEIIFGLLSFMEGPHRRYWENILDYNYKLQNENGTNMNLLELLTLGVFTGELEYYNAYLFDEERYNALRTNLNNANVNFTHANALELANTFSKEYDAIFLSNILDYFCKYWGMRWPYENLHQYSKELEKITRDNGIIFLNYLFYYSSDMPNFRRYVINSAGIKSSDLITEDIIVLEERKNLQVKDAILLRRVKKGGYNGKMY